MRWLVSLMLSFTAGFVSAQHIAVLDSNTFTLGDGVVLSKTSFRGLSVVDDQVIWISGSRGTIARSVDGGKTVALRQLKGYEKSDFRDIEAFDDKRAVIMSSGSPAYILKTIDGGQTWKEVFKRTDTVYFLDAMDFWDSKRGVVVGDPVNRHFVLLETIDGGETWQELDTAQTPRAMDGEAVFAASGTSLRCWGKDEFGFVSGGTISHFYHKKQHDKTYTKERSALDKPALGAFSFCVTKDHYLFAGGDYTKDSSRSIRNFSALPFDRKEEEVIANTAPPAGYKSCIELIEERPHGFIRNTFLVTGTSGTQVGSYGGFDHSMGYSFSVNTEPFHVARKAKKGKAVFLAGAKGKIGKLVY